MCPTKQEEYDASKAALDTKHVYAAIEETERHQQEFFGYVTALKKAAYEAARALETERVKSYRLQLQVQRLQDQLDESSLNVR